MNYEIVQDLYPISPRENECLGTIAYISTRYCLGDKFMSREELKHLANDKNNIVLPVYAYIHSGTTLNTTGFSCPWDSGQSGYIYVSKDKARKFFCVKRITAKVLSKIYNCLKAEVEEYSMFLNGEVYGYIIRGDDGNEIDSCYGFIGEDAAKEEAEYAIKFFSKKAA